MHSSLYQLQSLVAIRTIKNIWLKGRKTNRHNWERSKGIDEDGWMTKNWRMLSHPIVSFVIGQLMIMDKTIDILLPCQIDLEFRYIRRKCKWRKSLPFRWMSISWCILCISSRQPSQVEANNNPVDYNPPDIQIFYRIIFHILFLLFRVWITLGVDLLSDD
jgi:hypothetical protein